ncbi:MAG: hypothetical protein K6F71_14880 [Ruminococcus sp.]|uniref:hypothetical protein n=1 Tax=Ruminococcus sp. TaxID=41978 RepID=UPI0025DB2A41|nr:hypothetical protein [Ruminococcus sp.]MCR5542090.1 hypothetical protein [Ruminococcus sp.]
MKKIIILVSIICLIAAIVGIIFAVKSKDDEKHTVTVNSDTSSNVQITDVEKIKEIIEERLSDNGYELGFKIVFGKSSDWIDRSAPDHDIVIVRFQKNPDRGEEVESWDEYFSEVRKFVNECISDNNIDKNYVIIDQLE